MRTLPMFIFLVFGMAIGDRCGEEQKRCKDRYETEQQKATRRCDFCAAARKWKKCVEKNIVRKEICPIDKTFPYDMYHDETASCFKIDEEHDSVSTSQVVAKETPAEDQECERRQMACRKVYLNSRNGSTDSIKVCSAAKVWRKCVEGIIVSKDVCPKDRALPHEMAELEIRYCYLNGGELEQVQESSCAPAQADAFAVAYAVAIAEAQCPDGSVARAVAESTAVGQANSRGDQISYADGVAESDATANATEGGMAEAKSNSTAIAIDDGTQDDDE